MHWGARHGMDRGMTADILCIGSVLWDVIGRAPVAMRQGSDVAGRITQLPGGVALNIAQTLAQFGLTPALLTAVGRDPEGEALIAACRAKGLVTETIYRPEDLPTDRYMAVEGANGVIAAIADAHSLEAAGARILAPLSNGQLPQPYRGPVALDGNLTHALLAEIAASPLLAEADLCVAPASPGKAERLAPFLAQTRGTLYVNLEEASRICETTFAGSAEAAAGLLQRGAARALVTDGGRAASDASAAGVITAVPPSVTVARVTGAGDTFMAAHIVAEAGGADPAAALNRALRAAATFVSGETPQ